MTTFVIREEHLDLLRAMHWRWDDYRFGGPAVDGKRPFGSSFGHYDAIAEVVGWEYDEDDRDLQAELWDLYEETLTVLQVGISAGSFAPGEYTRTGDTWVRVDLDTERGGAT